MKVTIVYQRPTRGMSCNLYPAGGIEVAKEYRAEQLHGVSVGSTIEMVSVFRLPENGEYDLEVTPHNMAWLKKSLFDRVNEAGKTIKASFALKWPQQMQFVTQFDPPTQEQKLVSESILTPVETNADKPKKKGRPAKATATPKVEVAAPVGDNE